ncbi:E3 ubiquitin-protein ligase hrd1 [Linderina pennispora]|nr:E3 ubiquitin-protein ligase hrd1 [Linderina pennispora]
MTTRSFVNKCRDWVRYRRAMQNMHLRYPTVSEEELEQMSDRTCIICREDMNGPARQVVEQWNRERAEGRAPAVSGDTPKKLPCGHVFHFNCLRSWLERQQSCPTCRHTVLEDEAQPAATSGVERGRNGEQTRGTDPVNQGQEDRQNDSQDNGINSSSSSSSSSSAAAAARSSSGSGGIHVQASRPRPPSSRTSTAAPGNAGTNPILPFLPGVLSPSDPRIHRIHAADPQHSLGGNLPAGSLMHVFPQSQAGTTGPYIPSLREFPMPDLAMLSDEQIRNLESDSRAAVAERIRILSALQVQLSHMVVALTQVQSIPAQAANEQSTVEKEHAQETKTKDKEAETSAPAPVHDSGSDYDVVGKEEDEEDPLLPIRASSKGKEPDIY